MEFLCLPMCVSVHLYASCAFPFPVYFFFHSGRFYFIFSFICPFSNEKARERMWMWLGSEWERSKKSSVVRNHNQNDFIKKFIFHEKFCKIIEKTRHLVFDMLICGIVTNMWKDTIKNIDIKSFRVN